MTALKKRARALEDEFAHNETLMFRAQARRNALLGFWAASAMHRMDGERYSHELVAADVAAPDGAYERIRSDFRTAGVRCSDEDLRERMVTLLKDVAREMRGF
ncbi:ATPase inhibitor subunit zeta [Rhizobium sp. TRM95111]|uniref:ATPase inhibitor subunit zeta n=1 Tax=Rhizobium alarense TaxID=2846851 RepID=UPI001F2F2A7A|nr:ATPase inhibitor subunit zeta [Rhizobium alarense]MCF3642515.1 ATPase inhibitor subunit zeta [Rhizobium alarense]